MSLPPLARSGRKRRQRGRWSGKNKGKGRIKRRHHKHAGVLQACYYEFSKQHQSIAARFTFKKLIIIM